MRKFYFDLGKICFGVGFYGCLSKVNSPEILITFAISSLILTVAFAMLGSKEKEE